MADDVLVSKAASVERCFVRVDWIDSQLADGLKRIVAFRNIAVHDQSLLVPILVNVITQHLDEFLEFTQLVLKRDVHD